jgi:hypothetical protein
LDAALSKLAEQIEHFGRNVFVDRALVRRAQGGAELRARGALLPWSGSVLEGFYVGLTILPSAALIVLFVCEAQNILPLAAGAAPATFEEKPVQGA